MEYKIIIDNHEVEVTEEVYKVYYQMDRRERYLEERDMKHHLNYYNALDREDINAEDMIKDPDADTLSQIIRKESREEIYKALGQLRPDERELIVNIYYYSKTEKEIAKQLGMTPPGVHMKKSRILKKLRGLLKE